MRRSMAGGLAALVAGALAIAAMNFVQRPASAAEALAEAAHATDQFDGWVHILEQAPGSKDFAVRHINMRTTAWAWESHFNGKLALAEMYFPEKLEMVRYTSDSHEIKVGLIGSAIAGLGKAQIQGFPLTLESLLANGPKVSMRHSSDDKLTRFDLTFPPDDQKTAAEQHRTLYPTSASVWVDPSSKLVQRSLVNSEGETREFHITYGDPNITDVYDLGVPRDTKVVDLRPVHEATALEDRLQQRSETGFGDYVALCARTSTDVRNGKQLGVDQRIEVYAASGAAYLAEDFHVGADSNHFFDLDPAVVRNWPDLSMDLILNLLKNKMPVNFLVSDGKNIWRGYATVRDGIQSTKIDAQLVLPGATLPGVLWPANNLRVLFGVDGKTEIVADSAHPGLVGLKIDKLYFMHAMNDTQLAQMYWFDPAKDDLSVESTEVYTSLNTHKVVLQHHNVFSAFAQTENGRWYPTRWQQLQRINDWPQGALETSWDTRVQLSTNKKLDAEWFLDPATLAATKPAGQRASSQAATKGM